MLNKFKVKNLKLKIIEGFTLIELLVVVTLIAILAVAVLATINPIEQRNKGRDTSVKQTAAEFISAEERYFATYGCFTWEQSIAGGATCDVALDPSGAQVVAGSPIQATFLSTVGEVKPNLVTRFASAPYSGIRVTEDSGRILHASFDPASKAFEAKANYTNNTCVTVGTTPYPATNFYCVPDTLE